MSHSDNPCRWSSQAGLTYQGQTLRGLLPRLKRHYYPTYEHSLAVHQPMDMPLTQHNQSVPTTRRWWNGRRSRSTRSVSEQAKARGVRTDQTIQKTVAWSREFHLRPSFFTSRVTRFRHHTRRSQPAIHSYCNKLSLACRQFWKAMTQLRLTPIDTQVPVCHASSRTGTLVDVVAKDSQGVIYILEIKDGYDPRYYFNSTGARMNPPFTSRTDCMFNQHQLQLQFTKLFYKQTFPHKIVGGAYLIRVHRNGYDIYIQESWVTAQLSESVILNQFQILCNTER